MNVFVHPQSICESVDIGDGTSVWAFAHVLAGASIGSNCSVGDGVFIENDVIVGDRVTIKPGVQMWGEITLQDNVFVGPNATFPSDRYPNTQNVTHESKRTIVQNGATVGANATVLPGVTVGAGAMVGAGSVVTRDVPPHGVVVGNPARFTGYTNTASMNSGEPTLGNSRGGSLSAVNGVSLVQLVNAVDMRGSLVAADTVNQMPFEPQRFFIVYDVRSAELRGDHAHKVCEQFLVCLKGSVSAIVDDGVNREEYLLNRPDFGLYMPPMTWGTQYRYSEDAVLLVLASHLYDNDDYVRNYEEFMTLAMVAAVA